MFHCQYVESAECAPGLCKSASGVVATGFILGSEVRPVLETSHTPETQEPLGPNIFRPYSGKSNMPWDDSDASCNPPGVSSSTAHSIPVQTPPLGAKIDVLTAHPVITRALAAAATRRTKAVVNQALG